MQLDGRMRKGLGFWQPWLIVGISCFEKRSVLLIVLCLIDCLCWEVGSCCVFLAHVVRVSASSCLLDVHWRECVGVGGREQAFVELTETRCVGCIWHAALLSQYHWLSVVQDTTCTAKAFMRARVRVLGCGAQGVKVVWHALHGPFPTSVLHSSA